MAFKTKKSNSENPTSSVVYKYGISKVLENEDLVLSQMQAGRKFQNDLIAVELDRREKVNKLCYPFLTPGLQARITELELKVDEIVKEIKKENSKNKSKKAEKSEYQKILKPIKAELYELWQKRSAELKVIRKIYKNEDRIKSFNDEASLAAAKVRTNTSAHWKTYNLIQLAVSAASKKPNLNFKRWDGSGYIGGFSENGLSTEFIPDPKEETNDEPKQKKKKKDEKLHIFKKNSDFYIEPLADFNIWEPGVPRSVRRKGCITTLWVSIPLAKKEGKGKHTPMGWAKFRLHLHRKFPIGLVKTVRINREKIGAKFRWTVDFTVRCPIKHNIPSSKVPAAIDIGWRKVEEGLRVATLRSSDGVEHLILPQSIIDRDRKVDSLKSIRKKNLNEMLTHLREWISTIEPPEWLANNVTHMHLWKSERRLFLLVKEWETNRFDGDSEIFFKLKKWAKQDKHLLDWQSNQRSRNLGNRREIYRKWAANICSIYGKLYVNSINLSKLAKTPAAEKDTGEEDNARVYRNLAALSILKNALNNAARSRGVDISWLNPENVTRKCSVCEYVDTNFSGAESIVNTCINCGSIWDQDENAAVNLMTNAKTSTTSLKVKELTTPPEGLSLEGEEIAEERAILEEE